MSLFKKAVKPGTGQNEIENKRLQTVCEVLQSQA